MLNSIIKNSVLMILSISYFLFRLVNLTKLPIFNGEGIYLDWGFRETHIPGALFYSLYDAKQPFLMWIFGIFESFISDPLFAGRFVSVIAGFLTMVGLYKISEKYFSKRVALFSSLIYIIVPIFVFYDRQALMESAIGAIGVWSAYYLLKVTESKKIKDSVILGIILGFGFFIKSSSFIFLISVIFVLIFYFIKNSRILLKNLIAVLLSFATVDFLLFINPQFWSTLSTNSRFVFTAKELLGFPISAWVKNLFGNLEISFFFITPLVFISSLIGVYFVLKNKNSPKKLVIYLFLSIFIQALTIKGTSQRYLVSFLPILVIFSIYGIRLISEKLKINILVPFFVLIFLPAVISGIIIFSPDKYFLSMGRFSQYTETLYIKGQTSGYGVLEAISYIKNGAGDKHAIAAVALNTGNPESAILTYLYKDANLKSVYLDTRLFKPQFLSFDCLRSPYPLYFVSREEQQGGLNKYLYFKKKFKNPYSNYSVKVYKLRENCSGKTIDLSPIL